MLAVFFCNAAAALVFVRERLFGDKASSLQRAATACR